MRAIAFAVQDATFRLRDCTVSETSGVWPFFAMFPATDWVEIPLRKSAGFALHSLATRAITDSECATTLTELGFVCAACNCTLPLAVYGCPRYSVAVALNTWLPPSAIRYPTTAPITSPATGTHQRLPISRQ